MADIKAIAEELVNLTVKEVNELATVLKDEYGIEPAAAAVAVAAGPAAGAAAAAEEKTSFDVVLAEIGSAKLQVVKAVKEACGYLAKITFRASSVSVSSFSGTAVMTIFAFS